jgi:hypothetical protein
MVVVVMVVTVLISQVCVFGDSVLIAWIGACVNKRQRSQTKKRTKQKMTGTKVKVRVNRALGRLQMSILVKIPATILVTTCKVHN